MPSSNRGFDADARPRLPGLSALLIVAWWLGGCDAADFRFTTSRDGERFVIPTSMRGSPAAACFDELSAADAAMAPDPERREQASHLGHMDQQTFRKRERQRQREWDHSYCRRQADCRYLAMPDAAAADISDSVELCLDDRAERRVAMGL